MSESPKNSMSLDASPKYWANSSSPTLTFEKMVVVEEVSNIKEEVEGKLIDFEKKLDDMIENL